MTKRSELIKEFRTHFTNSQKPAWEVYADLSIAREAKLLDEIEKPLKIFMDERNSGYGLTTMGAINRMEQALETINRLLGK